MKADTRFLIGVLAALVLPLSVLALNSVSTGFQVGSSAVTVDAHGVCQKVTATDGENYFVPTNTADEWSAFRTNKPGGISLGTCTSPYMGWKTDSGGEDWIATTLYTGGSLDWEDTGNLIPAGLIYSQVAVVDNYVYLFGGWIGTSPYVVKSIYRAPVSDPTLWTTVSKTLPASLYISQTAVIGGYVYLFGGKPGTANTSITGTIYRAPVSDPTSWSSTGKSLPDPLSSSQVAVIGDYVYLFGGQTLQSGQPRGTNAIYRAPVSDPTTWTKTGKTLPSAPVGEPKVAVIGDYVYLFGGSNSVIYKASVSDPTTWTTTGKSVAGSQLALIGDYVYMFGGGASYSNKILRAPLTDPTTWVDTGNTLPSGLTSAQTAIIGDHVYLFGGLKGSSNFNRNIYRAPLSAF